MLLVFRAVGAVAPSIKPRPLDLAPANPGGFFTPGAGAVLRRCDTFKNFFNFLVPLVVTLVAPLVFFGLKSGCGCNSAPLNTLAKGKKMAFNSLIFSRRSDNAPLTVGDIAYRAPAAFAVDHAPDLSRRYGGISTARAAEVLAGFGYLPTQAAQKKSRKAEGQNYAEHLLAFSNPNAEGIARADGMRPEVILYNSHDGSSSVRLFAGFYRFICSNGMVAGEGFETRIRHTVGSAAGFEDMVRELVARMPEMVARTEALRRVRLSETAAREMARRAAGLRWDPLPAVDTPEGQPWRDRLTAGAYFTPETVAGLILPRRYEDTAPDAFTVLNRIQEGVIRGGAVIRSVTDRNPWGKDRRARPVGAVGETVRINRALWDIAAEVAEVDPAPVVESARDLIAA